MCTGNSIMMLRVLPFLVVRVIIGSGETEEGNEEGDGKDETDHFQLGWMLGSSDVQMVLG